LTEGCVKEGGRLTLRQGGWSLLYCNIGYPPFTLTGEESGNT
jgi:hypothetical protein